MKIVLSRSSGVISGVDIFRSRTSGVDISLSISGGVGVSE